MVAIGAPSRVRASRGVYLAAGGILLAAVLVRLPYFWWPITTDEGGYALGAYWWSRGVTLYSHDLWFDRPQGIFVAYRLGMALLGDGVGAIRLWGALWFGACALGVWQLGRSMLGEREALLAALLTVVACASPWVEGFTANAEAFMVAATTASALLAWRGRFGLAGLAGGMAVMLKPSGGAALALCLVWLIQERASLRDWVICGSMGALPIVAGVIHGWATVGLEPYLDAAILFRLTHPVPDQLDRFVTGIGNTMWVTLPLAVLATAGMARLERRARAFCLAWLGVSIAGVAMGGNWWPHYFVQVVPPLALPAGALLGGVGRARRFPALASLTIVAALLAMPVALYASLGPSGGTDALYGRAGLLVEDEIGTWIRAHAAPDDRIYVAFSEPGLNYYARRLSVIPWLYIQQLTDIERAFPEVMRAVRDGEPRYVVLVDDGPHYRAAFERIYVAMGDRYEVVRDYEGATVYERRDP
ncbi:MAG: glycosyltransferase family 39 protein [Dehalococcoidia bacterium]